jgi:hypothetical protein
VNPEATAAAAATGPGAVPRPSRRRPLIIVAAVLVTAAALVAVLLAADVLRPNLDRDLTPSAVALPGEGADPLALYVVFPWPEEGFCSGQFQVTAEETATRVTISQVRNRDPLFSWSRSCAGIGTVGGTAAVDVILEQPLGERAVHRAVDGIRLDVRR